MSGRLRLESLLETGRTSGLFAGAAAGVASSSAILAMAFAGEARVEPAAEKRAAAADTLWDLASLTKPLAGAALALALAEERLLSLDDPVARFDDLYKTTRLEGVTPRSLLSHTAGLVAWFPCYVRGEGRPAYRKTLASLDAASRPGSSVLYSCPGFLLLADVVERAGAAPADRLFAERVAGPLGLGRDLLFSPSGADRDRAAGGERDDATERAKTASLGLRYGAFRTGVVNGESNDGNAYRRGDGVSLNAGLFGTLGALLAAGQAWLAADPRLLRRDSFAEATGTRTGGLEPPRGLGWQVATAGNGGGPGLGPGSYGHTGFTGASLFVDPGADRVFALLSNRLHPEARDVDMNEFRRRFHSAAADDLADN